MKICVAQTRPVKGDISSNIAVHKKLIELAVSGGAEMIVFPELSITGYEPELAKSLATTPDDNRFDDFQVLSDTHHLIIGIGVPLQAPSGTTISLAIFQPHQPRQAYHKKYLHPDEEPYFVSGSNNIDLACKTNTALAICYEISIPDHIEAASRTGAKIYIASVAKSAAKIQFSLDRLSEIAKTYSMVVAMSNCVGISNQTLCAGMSAVWNENGELVGQLNDQDEGVLIYDTENRTNTEQILI